MARLRIMCPCGYCGPNRIGNRRGFELGIDTNHSDVSLGLLRTSYVIDDFKVVTHRLLTFELRIQTHSNRRTGTNRPYKFRECFDARHPDTVFFEQFLAICSGRAKQVLFRVLDILEEVRKEDDAGRVGISPVRLKFHLEHDGRF